MKNHLDKKTFLNDLLTCFGDFNLQDPVCKKFCALNLQCVIERDQNSQLELLEDLISSEDMFIKIQ